MTRFLNWRSAVVVVVLAFVLIQFVPYSAGNPSARDEPKWDSPRTRELMVRACADCHSNETHVLVFERVAPVKWYVANHVKEGRAALNFSQWHTAAGEEARDAPEPLGEGSMPPANYTWLGLHGRSKLTASETQELIDGLRKTIAADPPTSGGG